MHFIACFIYAESMQKAIKKAPTEVGEKRGDTEHLHYNL